VNNWISEFCRSQTQTVSHFITSNGSEQYLLSGTIACQYESKFLAKYYVDKSICEKQTAITIQRMSVKDPKVPETYVSVLAIAVLVPKIMKLSSSVPVLELTKLSDVSDNTWYLYLIISASIY